MAFEGSGRHDQDGHGRLLRLVDVRVDADDPSLLGVELALEPVRRIGDLALRVALGDCLDHAAAAVDLVEVAPDRTLGLVRELLHEPRAAERIDRVRHARLLGDDLLLAQREQRSLRGGHGQRLVVRVRVQGLRPAEHRSERLKRDPRQVVERLLRGKADARGLGVEAHPGRRSFSAR